MLDFRCLSPFDMIIGCGSIAMVDNLSVDLCRGWTLLRALLRTDFVPTTGGEIRFQIADARFSGNIMPSTVTIGEDRVVAGEAIRCFG